MRLEAPRRQCHKGRSNFIDYRWQIVRGLTEKVVVVTGGGDGGPTDYHIVKVSNDFDGAIIKFNCQRCKDAKRPWKNKESRVEITANELQAHPFLDPDYEPCDDDNT